MLIISTMTPSFPFPCRLRPLLFPQPQLWHMGLWFSPFPFVLLLNQLTLLFSKCYICRETLTPLFPSPQSTSLPLLHPSALSSDFRELSSSFFRDQLQARSPVSCDVLGKIEWGGHGGNINWVERGKHIPILLKPFFCSLGLSWFHLHALLYFKLRMGAVQEKGPTYGCLNHIGSAIPTLH